MVVHHFLSSLSEAVLSVSSLDLLCGLTTVRFYSGVKWLCIRLIAFSYDRKNPLADKSRGVGAREPICCCYGYLLQSIKNCCTGFETKNILMYHFWHLCSKVIHVSISDNPLCCPDNLKSEKLCCLWTAITAVTIGQSLIRGYICNPWSKWSRNL